jgi:hypothetical protein
MNPLRNQSLIWTLGLALVASASLAALKEKPTPDFPQDGAALDVSGWSFRRNIGITGSGPQQLELIPDVLSRAQRELGDLRLMRGSEQVPYIIEKTTLSHSLTPVITVTNQPGPPASTLWTITLPRPNLPITRLTCASRTPLFQRDMTLGELASDERGSEYWHTLATRSSELKWKQTPDQKNQKFSLDIDDRPETASLLLKTENGDNPPIELENFQVWYPVTRLLFVAKPGDVLYLYYGNPTASPPQYDLSLVAKELAAANKGLASYGAEEQLNKTFAPGNRVTGKGGAVFWGILGLVVVVLLVIISRLLPKSDAQPPK